MAEEMVLKGFKDAGYEYIIIDDCWLDHERDENGKLQPNSDQFPSGIPALADYVGFNSCELNGARNKIVTVLDRSTISA